MNTVEIFLQPGEVMFAGADTRLVTLLGSCVAITLWHPPTRWGAMCHILLSSTSKKQVKGDGRFAEEAVRILQTAIRDAGIAANELEVKLFGGGSQFCGKKAGNDTINTVSVNNIITAKQLIKQAGWKLLAEHTGGQGYRQLKFDLGSGDIWLRFSPAPDRRYCAVGSACAVQPAGSGCG